MAAKGRLDIDTWRAFKRAKGVDKQRLLDQLVRDNEPLTIVLTAQLCGRGENRAGRRQKFKREPYVENLSLEEQESAGRIGMMKALQRFDPKIRDAVRAEHGLQAASDPAAGLPAFAAWRIKYELQAAIEKSGCITLRRGVAPQERPGVARLDDPEYVETALDESRAYLGGEGESLQERLAREEEEDSAPTGPRQPFCALTDFIARRCEFRRALFVMRDTLVGAYERHAHILGRPIVSARMLEKAILGYPNVVAMRGNAPGGRRGAFYRGVGVTTLAELSRRNYVASL